MIRSVRLLCLLLLMVGVALIAALLLTGSVGASGHDATRSFASPSVAPGGQIEVTITARNYGAFAQVVETIPGGFTFVGSSLPDAAVDARLDATTFTLLGEEQFTYTVQAPAVEAEFTFSGIVRDQHKVEHEVGGDTGLRVGPLTPVPTPDPQASPTAEPTPTATLVATPTPTATPVPTATPRPTATPTATPATPEPRPTATPVPEPTATPTPRPPAPPTMTPVPVVPTPQDGGGIPPWIWVLPLIVLVLVLGSIGYARRRR